MRILEGKGLKSQTSLPGEHSEREPPDPIPNLEVKPFSADDSVAGCHVKVGNRQALITNPPRISWVGFFMPKNYVIVGFLLYSPNQGVDSIDFVGASLYHWNL